jgi:hypothetical protein
MFTAFSFYSLHSGDVYSVQFLQFTLVMFTAFNFHKVYTLVIFTVFNNPRINSRDAYSIDELQS